MNYKIFIKDAIDYYEHLFGMNIPSDYYKKFLKNKKYDVFEYISEFLFVKELKEIYEIGLNEYGIDLTYNEFLMLLCDENPFYNNYKSLCYERKSFRQKKNQKILKKNKEKIKLSKKEKSKGKYQKTWKKSYKKSAIKSGNKTYRAWRKYEIECILLNGYDYEDDFTTNTGKEAVFADPWSWD